MLHLRFRLAAVALAASAASWSPLAVAAGGTSGVQIYQQRTPDGRVLLTDSPAPSAQTQKVWAVEQEDPAAARLRSEQVRLEAQTVSERIQRRMENQQSRHRDAEVDMLRANLAEARREIDRSRQASVVVVPQARRDDRGYGHPRFDEGAPRSDERLPRIGERSPRIDERAPRVGERSPRIDDRTPPNRKRPHNAAPA